MLVKSEVLREGIQELLEMVGVSSVRLIVTEGDNGALRLLAEGNMSVCEIELPACSSAFVNFNCTTRCEWEYPLNSFHLGMKALAVASESYLRINSEGMMRIQHLLETDMGQDTTIDFIIVSSSEETISDVHEHNIY